MAKYNSFFEKVRVGSRRQDGTATGPEKAAGLIEDANGRVSLLRNKAL
jgi:hypothetical protein